MVDLVRYLRDRGVIAERGHVGAGAGDADLPTRPARVGAQHDRAEDRAARRADRRLLVAASVQGHEFDSAVVAEALEMDAADVEERLERSSACTCSSGGRASTSFPTGR